MPIGPRPGALSTGAISAWAHRIDYVASFEIDRLPNTSLAIAQRLQLHLLTGGTCTVTTGDSLGSTYTCRLRPGTEPEIRYTDPSHLRYTMSLSLKNTAAAPLLCQY